MQRTDGDRESEEQKEREENKKKKEKRRPHLLVVCVDGVLEFLLHRQDVLLQVPILKNAQTTRHTQPSCTYAYTCIHTEIVKERERDPCGNT